MATKTVTLKTLQCPNCGAPLKAENNRDTITCVYCGNAIVPVEKNEATQSAFAPANNTAILRIDGIKTSSSALAYMEDLFEEYDWESFAYSREFSIREIDRLADSLKTTSADDKNTWLVCFKASYEPFAKKSEACRKILENAIREHKEDSLDAYSKFDAYRRISTSLENAREAVAEKLNRFVKKAEKYGASDEECSNLSDLIAALKNDALPSYDTLESVPEIAEYNRERNTKIAAALAEQGIDAAATYEQAKNLLAEKNYAAALSLFQLLGDYNDSASLADKIDQYFLLDEVLQLQGKLYVFVKTKDYETYSLYPTENGVVGKKPLIKNIGNILTNYADILYYLNGENKLCRYNFRTAENITLFKNAFSRKNIFFHKQTCLLLSVEKKTLISLNLKSGGVETLAESVDKIVKKEGDFLLYTVQDKYTENYETKHKTHRYILNLETHKTTDLGTEKINVVGFYENNVLFTQETPNQYNLSLYILSLTAGTAPRLLEKNIYNFVDVVKDTVFYRVGNSLHQTLVHISPDGTNRGEWPLSMSTALFEQGGWLYYIRRSHYNSILCKARMDGSERSIIAADIQKFIELKNGFLYYLDDLDTLVKIRMDGTGKEELCNHVESVLSIKENKVLFLAHDDSVKTGEDEFAVTKPVKSIYAVDFLGGGLIKLAYDVGSAKEFNEQFVYFTAQTTKKEKDGTVSAQDSLYRLDVFSNQTAKLLNLNAQKGKKKYGFAIAMAFLGFFAFTALIGLIAESGTALVIGLVGAIISGLVGASIRSSKPQAVAPAIQNQTNTASESTATGCAVICGVFGGLLIFISLLLKASAALILVGLGVALILLAVAMKSKKF